ncbi:hypothetical protein [Demequina sp.]|uniref:hypothetical protein n=1 Tax=Demequina sp. TaxID=2050685 RepID=UPI0025DFAB3F|nr:hypothetical protein [Demequina sp.]
MSTALARRPGSVTFVAALTWIAAALDLIVGGVMLWLSYNLDSVESSLAEGEVRWYGIMTLIVGALTAAVAYGVANGSQGARVFVMMVMILRIAAAAYALVVVGGEAAYQGVAQVVLALVVLGLLSTRNASDFFRGYRG